MKIAFVVPDDRFHAIEALPKFGAAPSAVLHGFSAFPDEIQIHIIACTHQGHDETLHLGPNIHFHGIAVPKIGFLRSIHTGCRLAVRKKIAEIHPDLIHAQGTERWCAVSTAWLPYPKVLTIHGNLEALDPAFKPKPRAYWKLQTLLQKLTLPHFDGVFCNSDYTRDCMTKAARHTWRVDNPIRPQFFAPPGSGMTAGAPPTLLNVGAFVPWKRQLELLGVAKKIHAAGGTVRFRFIGSLGGDDYGRACRLRLDEGERLGYAEYAGTMAPEALVREMDQANGFVHFPSEEAFGLVVAESLARGMKFFGCAVGGLKTITADVPGCELFEKDDFASLAVAIRQWVAEGSQRVQGCREIMAERYSPEVIARRHIEIYQSLVPGSPCAP